MKLKFKWKNLSNFKIRTKTLPWKKIVIKKKSKESLKKAKLMTQMNL